MKNQIKNFLKIIFLTFLLLLIIDQLFAFLRPNFLYPSHYDISNLHRSPKPYIEFAGLPDALDHNEYGYRFNTKNSEGDLNIAFFGGSTGYDGSPPIATLLEDLLREKFDGRKINVANFSVVSSNHRQHVHNIIESNQKFKPDIIIFYGGYNETAQTAFYDPRPGYPYNFFYRAETSSWKKILLEQSPIGNTINRVGAKYGWFDLTRLSNLRSEVNLFSQEWEANVYHNYFQTLSYAKKLANAFGSSRCQPDAKFRAFYQPYQVPQSLASLNKKIRELIHNFDYIHDVSETYSNNEHVYVDIVHVTQEGNRLMAKKIFDKIISDKLIVKCNLNVKNFQRN